MCIPKLGHPVYPRLLERERDGESERERELFRSDGCAYHTLIVYMTCVSVTVCYV